MIEKTYEVIDYIDSYMNKIKFYDLKKNIVNTSSYKLIEDYNKEKQNGLSNKLIELKKRLYNDPKINSYIKVQNDINMLTLYINKRIKDITKDTSHNC